jgi:Ca2+-binding EF-hand superfamily protein
MTLEGWADITNDLIEVNSVYVVVFIMYVLITHFAVINLVVGVIVEHIQHMSTTTDLDIMKEVRDRQHQIFQMLHHIFKAADVNNDNSLPIHEFKEILRTDPNVKSTLAELSIMPSEIDWLFETLDADGSGNLSIDEFVEGVLKCKESELSRQLMQIQYTLIREVRFMAKTIMGDSYRVVTNPNTGTSDAVPLDAKPALTSDLIDRAQDIELDKPLSPSLNYGSSPRRSVGGTQASGLVSLASVRTEVQQMEKEEHDHSTSILSALDSLRSEMREEMRAGIATVQRDVEDIRKNFLAGNRAPALSDNSVDEIHEDPEALKSPDDPCGR